MMSMADDKLHKLSDSKIHDRAITERRLKTKVDIIKFAQFVDVEVFTLADEFLQTILNQEIVARIKDQRLTAFHKDILPAILDKQINDIDVYVIRNVLKMTNNVETFRVAKTFISFLSEHNELSAVRQLKALNSFINKNTTKEHIIRFADDIDNVISAFDLGSHYVLQETKANPLERLTEKYARIVNETQFIDTEMRKLCVGFLSTRILNQTAALENIRAKVFAFHIEIMPFLQFKSVVELDVDVIKEILEKSSNIQTANVVKVLIHYLSGLTELLPNIERFIALKSRICLTTGRESLISFVNDIDNVVLSFYSQKDGAYNYYRMKNAYSKLVAAIHNFDFPDNHMYGVCKSVIDNLTNQNIIEETRYKIIKAFYADALPNLQIETINTIGVGLIKHILIKSKPITASKIVKCLISSLAGCDVDFAAKEQFTELNMYVKCHTHQKTIIQFVDDITLTGHVIISENDLVKTKRYKLRPESLDSAVAFVKVQTFMDPILHDLCIDFLNKLLCLTNVHEIKHKKVLAFKNDLLPKLQQVHISDVDALFIKNLLEDSKYSKSVTIVKAFVRFLSEMSYEQKLCVSKQLVALNSVVTNKASKETLIKYINDIESIDGYYQHHDDTVSNAACNIVLYVDTDVGEIKEALLACYFERKSNRDKCLPFLNNFNRSLSFITISSIYDLTFDIMLQQLRYVENLCQKHGDNKYKYCAFVKEFYLYVQKHFIPDFFEKAKIPINVVYRFRFVKEILTGYLPVHENHFEPTPAADKWLMIYDNKEEVNSQVTTCSSKEFDFTSIKNELFRNKVKDFIWSETISVGDKQSQLYALNDFFNFIDNLWTKKVISIYVQNIIEDKITEGMILAYKDYLHQKHGYDNHYYLNKLYCIKYFATYLQDAEPELIDGNIIFHLSNLYSIKKNTAKAMSDDELTAIAVVVNNNQDTLSDILSAIVFYLVITTEIRPSQIFALHLGSIQEASKKGQYVIESKTKVTGTKPVPQPITLETKRSIDNAIKLTQVYRDKCDDSLKESIFVLPDERFMESRNIFKLLSSQAVNKFISKCCKIAKIDETYNLSNLRDTHITLAREHVLRNNLSQLDQMVLNGHNNTLTDSEHYVDKSKELILALEAANHIIIGNLNLVGKVIDDKDMKSSDTVEFGCGYCSSQTCNMKSFLGCLMCNSFVTMPSRISYFDDYIKLIDTQIESKSIVHDKEDLVNIKRLLTAYLSKLLILKEGESYG